MKISGEIKNFHMSNVDTKTVGKRSFITISYFYLSNGFVIRSRWSFNTVNVMPKAMRISI